MHQKNGMNRRYSSVSPGPLVVTMSSSPNGPPVAYAYMTNTNGSSAALRTAARTALVLLALAEMFAGLVESEWRICPAESSASGCAMGTGLGPMAQVASRSPNCALLSPSGFGAQPGTGPAVFVLAVLGMAVFGG